MTEDSPEKSKIPSSLPKGRLTDQSLINSADTGGFADPLFDRDLAKLIEQITRDVDKDTRAYLPRKKIKR